MDVSSEASKVFVSRVLKKHRIENQASQAPCGVSVEVHHLPTCHEQIGLFYDKTKYALLSQTRVAAMVFVMGYVPTYTHACVGARKNRIVYFGLLRTHPWFRLHESLFFWV